jgi:hypothetical protein
MFIEAQSRSEEQAHPPQPQYTAIGLTNIADTLFALAEQLKKIEELQEEVTEKHYSQHIITQVSSLSESFRSHIAAIVAPLTVSGASSLS